MDPATGMVTATTPDTYGSYAVDPNSLSVTAYYEGSYVNAAYASIQNPSSTDSYAGDPTLNIFSFGVIAGIQGKSQATTVIDSLDCHGEAQWSLGGPAAGYSYTYTNTLDTSQSTQANSTAQSLGIFTMIPGQRCVFSGSIAADDEGPEAVSGTPLPPPPPPPGD